MHKYLCVCFHINANIRTVRETERERERERERLRERERERETERELYKPNFIMQLEIVQTS